jgi:excisionase family DNA binding protein
MILNYTPAQAADRLNCSVKKVYRLIDARMLLAFSLNPGGRGALRIPLESIERFEYAAAQDYCRRRNLDEPETQADTSGQEDPEPR